MAIRSPHAWRGSPASTRSGGTDGGRGSGVVRAGGPANATRGSPGRDRPARVRRRTRRAWSRPWTRRPTRRAAGPRAFPSAGATAPSAQDLRVFELVELGEAGHDVHHPFDRGHAERVVAGGSGHESHEDRRGGSDGRGSPRTPPV